MKIADYALNLQSSHSWSEQRSVQENLRIWVDPPPPPPSAQVSISDTARQQQSGEAAAIDNAARSVQNDPNLQLLIHVIERLTGLKVRLFDPSQLKAVSAPNVQTSAPPARAGYGVDYSRQESYSVSEQTTLQASGVIRTSDGKEIKFSLNLSMQFQYSETSSTSVRLGDAVRKSDPLVVNFNGTAAQLSEQRFAFDLNGDGKTEQVNAPTAGSGFLALDKNGDGKVNNGSELFGPASGNGFGELRQYDSDGNGWIDENDAVFNQLKVWTRDANGNDRLDSLAALGIGAISLHAVATPFDLKTASNQLLGSIRASSISLNEDGSAGSVQQVDLTV